MCVKNHEGQSQTYTFFLSHTKGSAHNKHHKWSDLIQSLDRLCISTEQTETKKRNNHLCSSIAMAGPTLLCQGLDGN